MKRIIGIVLISPVVLSLLYVVISAWGIFAGIAMAIIVIILFFYGLSLINETL